MSRVNCWICGKNEFGDFCQKGVYRIVKCKWCDFILVNPPPSQAKLDEFYRKFDYKSPQSAESVIRRDARRSLRVVSNLATTKRLLDMGCGRGYFLDEARAMGWSVKGIDYSEEVVKYATNRLHLDVKVGDILSVRIKNRFPLVTLNQVIEHVLDPTVLIRGCRELLSPKGYIYISTPNIESLSANVFGCDFEHLIPPEHVSFFSKRTLEKLLTDNGLSIVYQGSWSYSENVAGIIKRLVKRPKSNKSSLYQNYSKNIRHSDTIGQRIKYIMFDRLFCKTFNKLLEIDSFGINLEVIAQKN